jgi:hypothetical protein
MRRFWNHCGLLLRQVLLEEAIEPNSDRFQPKPRPRALRAGIRKPAGAAASRKKALPQPRGRRGVLSVCRASWRRCTLGPNRISSLGVWKRGARREALRINRMGETQWHRPHRARPLPIVNSWRATLQNGPVQ